MNFEHIFMIGTLFLCLLAGILYNWSVRRQNSRPKKADAPLYEPRMPAGTYVPRLVLFSFTLFLYPLFSDTFFLEFIPALLQSSIYLGILILLTPLLRRVIIAETCAFLWALALIPMLFRTEPAPLLVIPLPLYVPAQNALQILSWVWLAGFTAIMLWSTFSHLRFRRQLLQSAEPVEDPVILQIYTQQRNSVHSKWEPFPLMRSALVKTPLSVGLFLHTIIIVLPQKDYTSDELELILHHELVHILRRDSQQKFFMTVCAALLWFYPLAWLAIRSCSEDIELSCDEAVLRSRQQPVRKQYAQLLLQTAADPRGFTSCLSASAKALRYRLKSVVNPGKRLTGGLILFLSMAFLLLSSMFVGVSFRAESAHKLLFAQTDLSVYDVEQITAELDGQTYRGSCETDQALMEYIGGLPLSYITAPYKVLKEPRQIQLFIYGFDNNYHLIFGGQYLQVIVTSDGTSSPSETNYYQLSDEPDWAFILSCVADS